MKGMKFGMAEGLKPKSKKFNKVMLILAPLLVVALVVCVYNFISIQVEIAEKNEELSNLTSQVEEVENENKLLGRYSLEEYKIEYIETIARDKLGYAKPEERIYYIVPAD